MCSRANKESYVTSHKHLCLDSGPVLIHKHMQACASVASVGADKREHI